MTHSPAPDWDPRNVTGDPHFFDNLIKDAKWDGDEAFLDGFGMIRDSSGIVHVFRGMDEEHELAAVQVHPIVTVTQFQGPTMEFYTIYDYAFWLIGGAGDPDFAVDLHETWHESDPTVIRGYQAELDRLCEEAGL